MALAVVDLLGCAQVLERMGSILGRQVCLGRRLAQVVENQLVASRHCPRLQTASMRSTHNHGVHQCQRLLHQCYTAHNGKLLGSVQGWGIARRRGHGGTGNVRTCGKVFDK